MNDQNDPVFQQILELDESDKIKGMIYKISNKNNDKLYIGQVVSHRKNKGKYRPFGYVGRFNDHVSEAINNTKKKQCTYLNNAIRLYGRDSFEVELLEICNREDTDEREKHYIQAYNSLYPNGYNLTKGGKTLEHELVENNKEMQEPKKRGRGFGYVHKESTKQKMSQRLLENMKNPEQKKKVANTTIATFRNYYDNKKIEFLSEQKLSDDPKSDIRSVIKKDTDIVHDYIIKIKGKKLQIKTTGVTLEQKYEYLIDILKKAKELQNKKQNEVKIVEIPERVMDDPQPLI